MAIRREKVRADERSRMTAPPASAGTVAEMPSQFKGGPGFCSGDPTLEQRDCRAIDAENVRGDAVGVQTVDIVAGAHDDL